MIIVDVEIPIMGKRYDFQIDENLPIWEVKDQIAEIICQKEQCVLAGEKDRLLMWEKRTGKELIQDRTASENGLLTGSEIVMI